MWRKKYFLSLLAYVWKLLSFFKQLFSKLTILLPSNFPCNSHFLDPWWLFSFSPLVHALLNMHYPIQNASGECSWAGIMMNSGSSVWCWTLVTHKNNPSGFSRATELNTSQYEKGVQSYCSDLPDVTAEITVLIHHFSRILLVFLKPCLHFLLYQI